MKDMHLRRSSICLVLCLCLTLCLPIVCADMWPNMETVPQEEKEALLGENPVRLLREKTGEWSITCFAVSEDGRIAVGFQPFDEGVVYICDENGAFLYGYSFSCAGNYAISFDGENLTICFYRSNLVWTIDPNGNMVDVQRIGTGTIYKPTQLQSGSRCYKLAREIRLDDEEYARLVVTDKNGTERIVYDVTTEHNAKVIFLYALIVGLVIGFVCILIHQMRKGKFLQTDR